MARLVRVVLAVLVMAGVSVMSPQAAQASETFCGTRMDSGPIPKWGPIAIRAKGVSCRVAIPIAVQAAKRGYGKSKISGWSCNYRVKVIVPGQLANDDGTCKKGSSRIKFGWGA